MTTYRYKNAAIIERVDISLVRGLAQAEMVAGSGASGEQLDALRKKIASLGYSSLLDVKDGQTVIQVRGLKNEKAFIKNLEALDLAHNGVEKDLLKTSDRPEKFSERVRGKSLFLSALFYDLGNIALMISGIQRGRHNRTGKLSRNDWSEIATGGAFALGDVLMTFYGSERGDEELQAAAQGLKKHLHQKGFAAPQEDILSPDTLHQSGMIKATHRWLHKHIGQIKCLTELTGGLFMIHAGLKRDQATNNRNAFKVAAGALIATAWTATFLLEKPRGHKIFDGSRNVIDGKEPPPETLMDKITSNPRAWIAAPMAMSNNVLNLIGANKERVDGLAAISKAQGNAAELKYAEAKQHDYLWNVLTASSFLVAHSLFGLSGSKRPKETDDDRRVMNDLVLLSANVLMQQPEAMREQAIAETAGYVSGLAHVSISQPQIEAALRDKMKALSQKSSWAGKIQRHSTAIDEQTAQI